MSSAQKKKNQQKKFERNKKSFKDWTTTPLYQQSSQKRKAEADEQRRKEREKLYQKLKQERKALKIPLMDLDLDINNKTVLVESALIDVIFDDNDLVWGENRTNINKVSKRLVNITDPKLQERSADQLASLIRIISEDTVLREQLANEKILITNSVDTLDLIAKNKISDGEIIRINRPLKPSDLRKDEVTKYYSDSDSDADSDADADGLNKSRKKRRKKRPKKKSLESRKKRRKEEKSLKLRRTRRKRNKKKTKKRE
jgi:hypothetical protein